MDERAHELESDEDLKEVEAQEDQWVEATWLEESGK